MTEPSPQRLRWQALLRRSFGIPDVVSDENATLGIQAWIRERVEETELLEDRKDKAPIDVVRGLLDAAEEGELDPFLMGELGTYPAAPVGLGQGSAPEDVVMARAFRDVSGFTSTTARVLRSTCEQLADRLIDYVLRHPFQT
jgi:hypothetical protein